MKESGETKSHQLRIKRYILVLMAVWTLVITTSLVWNTMDVKRDTLEAARIQAGIAYEKDIIYRRWNAQHGGVYVPVTEETQPNPHLSDVPERDITTPLGKPLTLMNPAYMTRQVHELMEGKIGVKGHITSLNPIRPENAADEWETEALQAFENGESEISSVEILEGKEYMRLMRPLITEEGCLKCHAKQGYKEGDIRGGISVSVPMEPLRYIARTRKRMTALGHVVLWLIGMGGIVIGSKRLIRSEDERKKADDDIKKYSIELEEANKLKDLFIDIMRHDLLNPATATNVAAKIGIRREEDPEKKELFLKIEETNSRIIELIKNASMLAKLQANRQLQMSKLDLGQLLKNATDEMIPLADEKKIKITLDVKKETMARANPLIQDVFTNLIGNAIKYCPENSEVKVSIEEDDFNWKISVADRGKGIPDKYKETIFDRFKRIEKGGVKGTGLGLANVKRIVEAHNGKVWVEDNPGGGSVFYFTIPQD